MMHLQAVNNQRCVFPRPHRTPPTGGKADPVWDVAVTTKFSRKPAVEDDAPVTPRGALTVIDQFMSRVAELDYLVSTQHLELATTQQELRANGIGGFSLQQALEEDMEMSNIAESDTDPTNYRVAQVYDGQTVYASHTFVNRLLRVIEWEKFRAACGPLHRTRFETMSDGRLGIEYRGPDKRDVERTLAHRRHMKARWLDLFGELPAPEAIANARAYCEYHGNLPVLALMTDEEREAWVASRKYGTDDESRDAFHADPDPKPTPDQYPGLGDDEEFERSRREPAEFDLLVAESWAQYTADVAAWQQRSDDRGYAGPSGHIHLDID